MSDANAACPLWEIDRGEGSRNKEGERGERGRERQAISYVTRCKLCKLHAHAFNRSTAFFSRETEARKTFLFPPTVTSHTSESTDENDSYLFTVNQSTSHRQSESMRAVPIVTDFSSFGRRFHFSGKRNVMRRCATIAVRSINDSLSCTIR